MRRVLTLLAAGTAAVLIPTLASAQASISGTVSDTSGAVLPGVTVEVASPALIEQTRTTITDGAGNYRITSLRPGTYSSPSKASASSNARASSCRALSTRR
jgi:protocatechuate 3,4-dioxygenase beta subunit